MPVTHHFHAERPGDIALAAAILRGGGTVAFATETVYGLGANAFSATAVEKIFTAKQRPSWDPLIVHLASATQLPTITTIPPHLADRVAHLSAAFWPGPLTLLLPRNHAIPDIVTAGRPLVGVRVPSHPVALALLQATGLPLAAPSANTFGHTSPTTAAHVFADLDTRIHAVLDAGPTTVGLESTVLDPSPTPMVLYRPGAVTAEAIFAATGLESVPYQPATAHTPAPVESLPSPGVGIRHYAPRAQLLLVDGNPEALNHALSTLAGQHPAEPPPGVLLPSHWTLTTPALIQPWAAWDDLPALAATLFAALRSLDDRGAIRILCPLPPPTGLGEALRDRLQKAARPA